jgi:hypothetical protein
VFKRCLQSKGAYAVYERQWLAVPNSKRKYRSKNERSISTTFVLHQSFVYVPHCILVIGFVAVARVLHHFVDAMCIIIEARGILNVSRKRLAMLVFYFLELCLCLRKPYGVTYWQTGIRLDYTNSLLFVESAERFLHRRNTEDRFSTKFADGILVTAIASTTNISDSYVLLSFAVDHIESLITQWYPGNHFTD